MVYPIVNFNASSIGLARSFDPSVKDSALITVMFQLADMITHEFLDHQLEDTKEIANHYNTLKRMYGTKDNAALESWLFDQHLEL